MRQSHQHKGRWFVDHTIMCVFVISSTVAEAGDVVEELRLQIKTCLQQHVIGTFVFWDQCVYVLVGTWNHWLLILRGFVWVELVSIKAMQWLQTVFLFFYFIPVSLTSTLALLMFSKVFFTFHQPFSGDFNPELSHVHLCIFAQSHSVGLISKLISSLFSCAKSGKQLRRAALQSHEKRQKKRSTGSICEVSWC